MSLDTTLQQAVASVPECVAAGYVDISSGMLLSVRTVDSHPREVLDLVAAATADLYQGPNIRSIEQMFRRARGLQEQEGAHYFQEIIVNSENLIHIFMRGKRYPDYVMVFVCRRTANLGMALTRSRLAMPGIEAAI
ncbi:hypothetical protein ATCM_12130 [Stenotrophomonas sp. ATCM1_4]|jgi:hypothetical protein|uniref:Roadblock/LAMTOR2 domain-containing protein n=1 Tax=Stenotrophomonas capsici TaxID=3110230 RepID=A0ABU5V216_9GAMM|nr:MULTISPECIES: hypothetical protein [unclassified Stenotrophomonas]MBD9535179.1 hypothetical protein [Stenotrophomonas sp. STM01]MEA5667399.1 hypothetical protein [Stenotrophomonas sp. MH1]TDB28350.1 hypothetical protein ATCM_12130 [Stenotrophomonas sp. ATCM1_4]